MLNLRYGTRTGSAMAALLGLQTDPIPIFHHRRPGLPQPGKPRRPLCFVCNVGVGLFAGLNRGANAILLIFDRVLALLHIL